MQRVPRQRLSLVHQRKSDPSPTGKAAEVATQSCGTAITEYCSQSRVEIGTVQISAKRADPPALNSYALSGPRRSAYARLNEAGRASPLKTARNPGWPTRPTFNLGAMINAYGVEGASVLNEVLVRARSNSRKMRSDAPGLHAALVGQNEILSIHFFSTRTGWPSP
jgi:hypothetical protein